jgi:hypothetical protein
MSKITKYMSNKSRDLSGHAPQHRKGLVNNVNDVNDKHVNDVNDVNDVNYVNDLNYVNDVNCRKLKSGFSKISSHDLPYKFTRPLW